MELEFLTADARIVSELVVDEGGQLAEQLDAHQSTPNADDSQELSPASRVRLDVRLLEQLDDVISQKERVGDRLECARVLRPGDQPHVGPRAERDDDMVVRQLADGPFGPGDANDLSLDVHLLHGRLDEASAAETRADWLRAVAELQHAGARLEEQWRKEEEVVAADERDLDLPLPGERTLQMASGRKTGNTTPEDDDTRAWLGVALHGG
jgi:hypothetical protein